MLFLSIGMRAQTQTKAKTYQRSGQAEDYQQLKQALSRKIDSISAQLPVLASNIDDIRKKIDELKKQNNNQDRPDPSSGQQSSRLATELQAAINTANTLQKKFDMKLSDLDKALSLQKNLDEKINALAKDTNLKRQPVGFRQE